VFRGKLVGLAVAQPFLVLLQQRSDLSCHAKERDYSGVGIVHRELIGRDGDVLKLTQIHR
jgi:hypothetical protein